MKSVKALLVVLLAWTFSVQAIAKGSMVGCRHSLAQSPGSAPAAADTHAVHGGGHAGHTMAAASAGVDSVRPNKKMAADVPTGCDCDGHCGGHQCSCPAPGLACNPHADTQLFFTNALRPVHEQPSPLSAHAHDLVRPPSIT